MKPPEVTSSGENLSGDGPDGSTELQQFDPEEVQRSADKLKFSEHIEEEKK